MKTYIAKEKEVMEARRWFVVDAENQVAIINILRQVNDIKKITIVFTTHDRFQVNSLAHHILFLDNGKLSIDNGDNLFIANRSSERGLSGPIRSHN